jgi:hypothetical protein
MAVIDCTSRDDQDEIWGKVIDAVDDDSLWAENNLDDFSVSVYEKSVSDRIVPTVVKKRAVTMSTRTDITNTTPFTPVTAILSTPLLSTTQGKTRKSNLSEMKVEKATSKPLDELQYEHEPSNDFSEEWSAPLEIFASNEDTGLTMSTEVTSSIRRFTGLETGKLVDGQDVDEPYDEFAGILSHKFNKSLGDLPSNNMEDLVQSPLDFLKSWETNINTNKNGQIWKSGTIGQRAQENSPCTAPRTPESERVAERARKGRTIEISEKRCSKSSGNKIAKSPSQGRNRMLRSTDQKKKKCRNYRSQSRDEERRYRGKNRSARDDRPFLKPNKSLEKSRHERRTITSDPQIEDITRRARSGRRSRSRTLRTAGDSRRSESPRRSSSNSFNRRRRSNSRSVRRNDRTIDDHSRPRNRSRSAGPVSPTCSSDGRKKDKERSTRQDFDTGRSRNRSRPPEKAISPIKVNSRQRRGSDKRSAPTRAKSEDLMDLLGASLGILSFDPSRTSSLEATIDDKSQVEKRPQIKRAKSMITNPQMEMPKRDLRNGLCRLDKVSGKSPSRRSDQYKSAGGASSTTNSTKRSSSSSRGSKISDAGQADRILKEQAKLAREQRRAEEAKLKRLQEESRLLEERTRSEEMRLKALKEEAKIWEAKRMEEETRAKIETEIAPEMKIMYESDHEQGEREGNKEMEDQNSQKPRENETKVQLILKNDETTSLPAGSRDTSNRNGESLPRRRSHTFSFSQTTKKKFGGLPENIELLPPAFQVLHEQSKRIEKL